MMFSLFREMLPAASLLMLSTLTRARSSEVPGGDQVDGSAPAPVPARGGASWPTRPERTK
eukprot:4352204-Pyramimonas_sp.AAC.1